jgi:hypothetical protein
MPKHNNQSRSARILANKILATVLQDLLPIEFFNFSKLQAIRQSRD